MWLSWFVCMQKHEKPKRSDLFVLVKRSRQTLKWRLASNVDNRDAALLRLGRLTCDLWLLRQVLAGATVAAEEANSKADISGCYTKSSLVVCSSFVLNNTSLLLNCSFTRFSGSFDSTYVTISGIEASVVKTIKMISPQPSLVTSKSRSYHVCKWQQYTTALWPD